jgi:hypothetical protein
LIAFAAINYTIIHSPIVLLLTFVLLVHELAHYYYAKSSGAQVTPPIFLPLPFIAVAMVKIKNLSNDHKAHVALAGPFFAILTLLFFISFNLIFYIFPFYMLFIFILFEFVFNFIGSDGAKYRSTKSKD